LIFSNTLFVRGSSPECSANLKTSEFGTETRTYLQPSALTSLVIGCFSSLSFASLAACYFSSSACSLSLASIASISSLLYSCLVFSSSNISTLFLMALLLWSSKTSSCSSLVRLLKS
jgi:hypothetical protein